MFIFAHLQRKECHRNIENHFKFLEKQINDTKRPTFTWESFSLKEMYLHCPTDELARLTLTSTKRPKNDPRIQFHIRYKR